MISTNGYTKGNTSQLSLWEEPVPEPAHHHIEAIFLSGYREIYCTANAYRPARPGEHQWEAGFVGFAENAESCSICNAKRAPGSVPGRALAVICAHSIAQQEAS